MTSAPPALTFRYPGPDRVGPAPTGRRLFTITSPRSSHPAADPAGTAAAPPGLDAW